MSLKFLAGSWDDTFQEAFNNAEEGILIICPFMTLPPIQRLLGKKKKLSTKVITRFDQKGFYERVTELDALEFLLIKGAQIKGVRNLHAKVYVFDSNYAIVTSANLTDAALGRNHEFGIITTDADEIVELCKYFDELWQKAGPSLTEQKLRKWIDEVNALRNSSDAGQTAKKRFKDYGKNLRFDPSEADERSTTAQPQYFVKFFGKAEDRAKRDQHILELVSRDGCHWACSYPKNKRPRRVCEGATMFMGQLVEEPNDILIFGRAIAQQYREGRDDASRQDIKIRNWKKDWPHYIRVHNPQFIDSTLENGISLYKFMDKFGFNSFVSTQGHEANESGNINPRKAYMRQADVQLTGQGAAWMDTELERRFKRHGQISNSTLKTLDWPDQRTP